MQWQWKPYGEVLLPNEVRESLYRDGGKLRYQRELALEQSVLNATIDSSLFTYRGLGVRDVPILPLSENRGSVSNAEGIGASADYRHRGLRQGIG